VSGAAAAVAFVGVPLFASEYWFSAILIPFLIFALAALGLNILTGYAGQLSLGSAAFMAVGAYAAYNFSCASTAFRSWFPSCCGGLTAAGVGMLFGLPSLRIKGFYLAVATLAAQFFIVWCADQVSLVVQQLVLRRDLAQKLIIFGLN
jgi:branched-chain amino acid transport system permease protein